VDLRWALGCAKIKAEPRTYVQVYSSPVVITVDINVNKYKNMAKKKDYYLKPNEIITAENAELGVVYHAAVPLREFWWRPISSCCQKPLQREIMSDAVIGDDILLYPQQKINTTICSKCHKECEKRWAVMSRLIPDISRSTEFAQKYHEMDDRK
jgi:hypothetical protein